MLGHAGAVASGKRLLYKRAAQTQRFACTQTPRSTGVRGWLRLPLPDGGNGRRMPAGMEAGRTTLDFACGKARLLCISLRSLRWAGGRHTRLTVRHTDITFLYGRNVTHMPSSS